MVAELLQYLTEVLLMVFLILGVDDEVVDVGCHELVHFLLEDVVDEALEGRGCVGQAKGQHKESEGAVASAKGRLVLVPGADAHLMITGAHVES